MLRSTLLFFAFGNLYSCLLLYVPTIPVGRVA